MTQFLEPAQFYCKVDVIACLGINHSRFYPYLKMGIIPPPDGRDGNQHLWNSNIINAIATQMRIKGSDYTFNDTLDILIKRLEVFERNFRNHSLERLYDSGNLLVETT